MKKLKQLAVIIALIIGAITLIAIAGNDNIQSNSASRSSGRY